MKIANQVNQTVKALITRQGKVKISVQFNRLLFTSNQKILLAGTEIKQLIFSAMRNRPTVFLFLFVFFAKTLGQT